MNDELRKTDHEKAIEQNHRLRNHMSQIERMDIREFRETGYLQELNRLFLHPLGLALEVVIHEDGTETLGGIWDARKDPEGILYDPTMIDPRKVNLISEEMTRRCDMRLKKLGFFIQPD